MWPKASACERFMEATKREDSKRGQNKETHKGRQRSCEENDNDDMKKREEKRGGGRIEEDASQLSAEQQLEVNRCHFIAAKFNKLIQFMSEKAADCCLG